MKTLTIKTKTVIILLVLAVFSCQKDNIIDNGQESILNVNEFIEINEGRLHFSNKEFLHRTIERMKNMSTEEKADFLSTFYKQDFLSLRPIVRMDNESLYTHIENLQQQLIASTSRKLMPIVVNIESGEYDFNNGEKFIADNEFASLINGKGEIQVGNKIYKYTDRGLYFVEKEDINQLYIHLESQDIKPLLLQKKDYQKGPIFSSNIVMQADPIRIDERISHFQVHSSYNVVSSSTTLPTVAEEADDDDDDDVTEFINSLTPCDQINSVFSSILGPAVYCYDRFDDNYRIETKFWAQNYFLFSSTGSYTQTQKLVLKTYTGKEFWWPVSSDELRLGINRVIYISDNKDITVKLHNVIQNDASLSNLNSPVKATAYAAIGEQTYTYDEGWENMVSKLPKFPFVNHKTDLNCLIIFPARSEDVEVELFGNTLTINGDDIIQAKEELWNAILKGISKLLKDVNKSINNTRIGIQIIDDENNEYVVTITDRKIHKVNTYAVTDIWDISLPNLSISIEGTTIEIQGAHVFKPQSIDIYGIGKRGDTWKGSRIIWTKAN